MVGPRVVAALWVGAAVSTFAGAAAPALLGEGIAEAAPPEPSGGHPRLFLDAASLARMRQLAGDSRSAVARAIAYCDRVIANPNDPDFVNGGATGLGWQQPFGACAIAFVVRGDAGSRAQALRYFHTYLYDQSVIGDNQGGDDAVRPDAGYAMRAFAPYAAIAYDWLHDLPEAAELLPVARQRFKAWTDWYRPDRPPEGGFNGDTPGTNYHAGFAVGTALIAVAQAGEGGADSAELWSYTVDTLFGSHMASAFADGAVLDGGDWFEGWQYGPLSVVEYAMASRALREAGASLGGYAQWEGQLVARAFHALTPDRSGSFVGGDADLDTPYRVPSILPLYAALIDAVPPSAGQWAVQQIQDLHLTETSFFLMAALAEARAPAPAPFPADASTWYYAKGSRILYSRSDWSQDAAWLVTRCAPTRIDEHSFHDAGNLVWSRGADNLIVDPTPYGSISTLNGNAPTVRSNIIPEDWRPSHGYDGRDDEVDFLWRRQTAAGVVAARCDWRGQLRFRDTPADLSSAIRDVVMVPVTGAGGTDAAVIVVDRVTGSSADRPLLLRFRTPGDLTQSGSSATARVGASTFSIHLAYASGGTPTVRTPPTSDSCTDPPGACEVARFPVHEWSLSVPGPTSEAVHVLSAGGAAAEAPYVAPGTVGYRSVELKVGIRQVAVIVADAGSRSLTYRATLGDRTHVVLGAPAGASGRADVTATASGDHCEITVAPHDGDGGMDARPLILTVDDQCQAVEDPTRDGFMPPPAEDPPPGNGFPDGGTGGGGGGGGDDDGALTGGCCETGGGASSLAPALIAGALLLRRRRRD